MMKTFKRIPNKNTTEVSACAAVTNQTLFLGAGEEPRKRKNSKAERTCWSPGVLPSLSIAVLYLPHFCQYSHKKESYHKYILKGEEHNIFLSLISNV